MGNKMLQDWKMDYSLMLSSAIISKFLDSLDSFCNPSNILLRDCHILSPV